MSNQSVLMLLEGTLKAKLARLMERGAYVLINDDGIYVYSKNDVLLLKITPQTYEQKRHLL